MSYFQNILAPLVPRQSPIDPLRCWWAFGQEPGGMQSRREQRPCYSHEDIKTACRDFMARGWNSYVAHGSYLSSSNGRGGAHVALMKSFFCDIDVGKANNSYATREDAALGIREFVLGSGLRPTYIISSGNGFYLYWCLDQAITPDVWSATAERLRNVATTRGFIIDPHCTTDLARVLRVPFTIHQGCGRTVEILRDTGRIWTLPEFEAALTRTDGGSAPSRQVRSTTTCASGDVFSAPTPPSVDAADVARLCPQMRSAPLAPEPAWYAMLCVLKRCVNGREWAHRLSALDTVRYLPADTDKKFDHAPDNSPATCQSFDMNNPGVCPSCPYYGQVKSPIQLPKFVGGLHEMSEASAPALPEQPAVSPNVSLLKNDLENWEKGVELSLPPKFTFNPVGLGGNGSNFEVTDRGILYKEHDPSSPLMPKISTVTRSSIWYIKTVWSYRDGMSQRLHWFRIKNPNGHVEDVGFDSATLTKPEPLMAQLSASNVFPVVPTNGGKIFVAFMNAYLNALLNNDRLVEIPTSRTFGWQTLTDKQGNPKEGFAIGEGFVTASGIEPMEYTGVASNLAKAFHSRGTMEQWKAVPNMYKTLDQKPAQLAMCLAFAAPLMKYGSGVATSATYNLWSTASGLGKTQLLRACASVWGDPDRQFIQRQASETARQRQLAMLNNLPAFMDEITDVKDEDLFSLAYSLVGGQEKNKLKRNGVEMAETGTWNTVTFCTSNRSMKEAVARKSGDSGASVVRVIEYECDFPSYAHDARVQDYINQCMAACAANYGLAGPNFIHNVLRNFGRLKTLTHQVEYWASQNGFRNDERFMAYPLALALKAGQWAKEWGILDYDMEALERWILEVFVPHNRSNTKAHVASKRPKDIMLAYLHDRQRNFLMVETDERTEPLPPPGNYSFGTDSYVRIIPDHADIHIRFARVEALLYITMSDLKKWCAQNGHSLTNLIKTLNLEGVPIRETVQCLTAGVPTLVTPTIPVYVVSREGVEALGFDPSKLVPNAKEIAPVTVAATDAVTPQPQPVDTPFGTDTIDLEGWLNLN